MSDKRTRDQNRQANRSSCPYPLTTDYFPVTSRNPLSAPESQIDCTRLGLSNYFRDRYIMPGEVPVPNTQSSPSAPFIDGFSDGRPTHARSASGFSNPMDHQAEATPCEPPPSYAELYDPKFMVLPKTPPYDNPAVASDVRSPGTVFRTGNFASTAPITVPVSAIVQNNRVITYPTAQLMGVRSNSRNSGSGACLTSFMIALIAGLAIFVVLAQMRWR